MDSVFHSLIGIKELTPMQTLLGYIMYEWKIHIWMNWCTISFQSSLFQDSYRFSDSSTFKCWVNFPVLGLSEDVFNVLLALEAQKIAVVKVLKPQEHLILCGGFSK